MFWQFGTGIYGSTFKISPKNDDDVVQAMNDLGDVVKLDCSLVEEAFAAYGKLDYGEDDVLKMIDNPSEKMVKKARSYL